MDNGVSPSPAFPLPLPGKSIGRIKSESQEVFFDFDRSAGSVESRSLGGLADVGDAQDADALAGMFHGADERANHLIDAHQA